MSRRKRRSWISTGRSTSRSELLRELDAIAVRVVDIEKAHHAVRDLDDDPDVDACRAQPVGDALHVVHVDVGDDAVVTRDAFGEPDLHRAVLQVRPALVEVDGVLLEAERLAVEASRLVEVAHVVPDAGRHQRARPGSCSIALTVFRNSAPVAPSTARWSHVIVIVMTGRTCSSASRGTTISRVCPTARIEACGGFS